MITPAKVVEMSVTTNSPTPSSPLRTTGWLRMIKNAWKDVTIKYLFVFRQGTKSTKAIFFYQFKGHQTVPCKAIWGKRSESDGKDDTAMSWSTEHRGTKHRSSEEKLSFYITFTNILNIHYNQSLNLHLHWKVTNLTSIQLNNLELI